MNGRPHAIAGAATTAPLTLEITTTTDVINFALMTSLASAAALAPDIDHAQNSKAIRYLGPAGRPISNAVRRLSEKCRIATGTPADHTAWNKRRDPDHRGLTHTMAAATIAGTIFGCGMALLGLDPWSPGVSVFFGWLSAVVLDGCTRQGVPILWPLKIRGKRWYMVRFARLESGTSSDWWVVGLWVAVWLAPSAWIVTHR